MGNIEKITGFMDECRKMGLDVLGPDVNESAFHFSVNKEGQIRFGLGAIKGNGEAAAAQIIEERKKNGNYETIYDLVARISTRSLNKKSMESMVYAGALDSLGLKRWQYFTQMNNATSLDNIIKYGQTIQQNKEGGSGQVSLFGSASDTVGLSAPKIPNGVAWSDLETLNKEKDVVGFYLSGHPLDNFAQTIRFSNHTKIKEVEEKKDQELTIIGIIESRRNGLTKMGDPFCSFVITDYDSSLEIALFKKDYMAFHTYAEIGHIVQIKGRYEKRFRDSTDYKFSIHQIVLLSEVLEKNSRELILHLDVEGLYDWQKDRLDQLLQENEGSKKLVFSLFDSGEPTMAPVPMVSNSIRVGITEELITELEKLVDRVEVR